MSLSILIVDDDRLTREKLKSMLRGQGYRVQATDEWPEITKIVANENVDVILMDIEMPHLSGDRIASVILKRMDNPPRILLHSGLPSVELSERTKKIGAHGYIPKGLTAQQYSDRIEKAVARSDAKGGPRESQPPAMV